MNAQEILAATGGLPPSEFELPFQWGLNDLIPGFDHSAAQSFPQLDTAIDQTILETPQNSTNWNEIDLLKTAFGYDNLGSWEEPLQKPYDGISNFGPLPTEDSSPLTAWLRSSEMPLDGLMENTFPNSSLPFVSNHETIHMLDDASMGSDQFTNSSTDTTSSTGTKTTCSKVAKGLLNDLFLTTPYPSHDEVGVLARQTELTEKQVKSWFTNKRARSKPRGQFNVHFHSFSLALAVIPLVPSTKLPADPTRRILTRRSLEALNRKSDSAKPPDAVLRFLESPSEERHIDSGVLEEAARSLSNLQCRYCPNWQFNRPGSVHSSGGSVRSADTPYSAGSLHSERSAHSARSSISSKSNQSAQSAHSARRSIRSSRDSIHSARSSIHSSRSSIHSARSSIHSTRSSIHSTQSSIHSARSSVYSAQSVHSIHSGSAHSIHSGSFTGSSASIHSRMTRRGRRRFPIPSVSSARSASTFVPEQTEKDLQQPVAYFACTFSCPKFYLTEYDWKRHETTVHVPQSEWICNHPGVKLLPDECPYDLSLFPTTEHMNMHRHDLCTNRPIEARTFYRRDHLVQHLKLVHRIEDTCVMAGTIESWRSSVKPLLPDNPALHCGFCGKCSSDWNTRGSHVGEHFKAGKNIEDWWPERLDNTMNFASLLLPSTSHEYVIISCKVCKLISCLELTPNSYNPTVPFGCTFCGEIFVDLETARTNHVQCRVYSCRFITSLETIIRFNCDDVPGCGCNKDPIATYDDERLIHLQEHHFRRCKQHLFFSEGDFAKHLEAVHFSPACDGYGTLGSGPSLSPYFRPLLVTEQVRISCSTHDGVHVGLPDDSCRCEQKAKFESSQHQLLS
jgi:hypothetical protein